MKNSPENHEEYHALLDRIVRGAEYLDNPLIKPEDKAKGEVLYDELVRRAIRYREAHGEIVGERKESA